MAPGCRSISRRTGGKGWVNAALRPGTGVENLPIIAESGLVVGTGTPTLVPATPTPTLIPAWEDGDSATIAQSPSVIFDPVARRHSFTMETFPLRRVTEKMDRVPAV